MSNQRLKNLDAARGAAMVLVCLSHFTQVYLARASTGATARLGYLYALGMIASPTFVAISGTVLGLLYVVKREGFAALRIKLLDRSLFLLTVAHVLIACSRLTYQDHPIDALRMTFMTDTIGVCVIAGVFLITVTSRVVRCVLGAFCFGLAWRLLYLWTPSQTLSVLAKEVLVGSASGHVLAYTVPILPWFGVYIAATALGEYVGEYYRRANLKAVERTLLIAGSATTGLALAVRALGWVVTSRLAAEPKALAYWGPFFSPWSKLPPGPDYVLFFGGLGLLLIWGVTVASHRARFIWLMSQLAIIGRSSLAVFTFQFYVYFTLLGSIHLRPTMWWPAIFVASLAIILAFARWWDRHGFNRVFTVGIARLIDLLHRERVLGKPSLASAGRST